MAEKKPFERLPKDVKPVNYAIRLKTFLDSFTFDGNEDILLQVEAPVRSITINSLDIKVKEATFQGEKQSFSEEIDISYSQENETVTFGFPEDLQVGKGTLSLSFSGELNDKLKGFYRSKYTSQEGQEQYAAVTQFESSDARRAFPCWDEPAIRATFDITLVVPKDKVALSNMPEKSVNPDSDAEWKVVEYEQSPIMSTYLIAFIVGEYDFVEATDTDGVKVRVYTPVGKKDQGKFALDVAVKTLPFYKDYFDIAYTLPKIDLIAIADCAAGAMENWGLLVYRETTLLIDAENSSSAACQEVALTVGHELAHQWFGNLVTLEWWTHLWLKEGFASWIEYLCVDKCFPEYDIWTQFASSSLTVALEVDALKNSHPIEVPVGHPDEVEEIFDVISYSKGASVIRMLHDFIGDKDFREGMHDYLSKHKYSSTFTEDLWEALQTASGKPIDKIMSTWTKQMGFPVLDVSQKVEGTRRVLTIRQDKFCADGSTEAESLWSVPVSISTASSPAEAVHHFVLEEREVSLTVENVKPDDWLKLNTGAVGFYRTKYSSEMLEALIKGIEDLTLPPRDRLGLQNDLFALAQAGTIPLVQVLKVAQAFESETNYTVWKDLSTNLVTPLLLSQYTDFYESAKAFVRKLFTRIGEELGWQAKPGETHGDAMLRSLVIGRLGEAGHEPTVAEARNRFKAYCDGSSTSLPPDLREPVFSTVLHEGGDSEFEEMLKLFRAADLHEEKARIMRSLGKTQKDNLIQKTLKFAMSDEVRSQDTLFVIRSVKGSKQGRDAAWQFVQDNWSKLEGRYKGSPLLTRIIKSTTENFVHEEKATEIQNFFDEHPAPVAERTIKQSIECIHLNKNQLGRNQDSLEQFFSTF